VAAAFQAIGKADQVGIDIGRGIDRRMDDTELRCKMRDIGEALLGKQRRHGGAIGKIAFFEMEIPVCAQFAEAGLL
jgi:hypothetical protein